MSSDKNRARDRALNFLRRHPTGTPLNNKYGPKYLKPSDNTEITWLIDNGYAKIERIYRWSFRCRLTRLEPTAKGRNYLQEYLLGV